MDGHDAQRPCGGEQQSEDDGHGHRLPERPPIQSGIRLATVDAQQHQRSSGLLASSAAPAKSGGALPQPRVLAARTGPTRVAATSDVLSDSCLLPEPVSRCRRVRRHRERQGLPFAGRHVLDRHRRAAVVTSGIGSSPASFTDGTVATATTVRTSAAVHARRNRTSFVVTLESPVITRRIRYSRGRRIRVEKVENSQLQQCRLRRNLSAGDKSDAPSRR